MKLKSMYGRQYIGIDRSTFIVGVDGKIIKEWRSVKVTGHVDEVLKTIKDLG
jgi:peroxiredoxin Q/BCP